MQNPFIYVPVDVDEEWAAELTPYAERMHMCLTEAGYPKAEVEIGPTGVFASGAPLDVIERAADVADGAWQDREGGLSG